MLGDVSDLLERRRGGQGEGAWLRELADKPGAERSRQPRADDETRLERALLCARCHARLASAGARFEPTGDGTRFVFANPAGRLFEIVTLPEASNVIALGEPVSEFTWFPGCAWRVLVCASCGSHLGWRFDALSPGPPSFVGLITSQIIEAGEA